VRKVSVNGSGVHIFILAKRFSIKSTWITDTVICRLALLVYANNLKLSMFFRFFESSFSQQW